jgi:hypothetical protein
VKIVAVSVGICPNGILDQDYIPEDLGAASSAGGVFRHHQTNSAQTINHRDPKKPMKHTVIQTPKRA